MFARFLILAAGLAASTSAIAQVTPPPSSQNADNWDVFQKLYPQRALAAREEGAVGFVVGLDNKGQVTDCKVTHSSGHPRLDAETCDLISLHAQFKPDATGSMSQVQHHEGMIVWRLPGSKSDLQASRPVSAASAVEKTICKKTPVTGSNAAFERTCMTPTEWAKQSDESRAPWEELQGKKGMTAGN